MANERRSVHFGPGAVTLYRSGREVARLPFALEAGVAALRFLQGVDAARQRLREAGVAIDLKRALASLEDEDDE